MIFLFVLVLATAAVVMIRPRQRHDGHMRLGLAIAMGVAGLAHFLMPEPFVQHLPEWVPERHALIYATGAVEIALGAALVWPARWRALAGLALAAYLVAVFPANVYVAVEGVDVDGQPGGVYPWLRLPLQALFVWLAVWSTGATGLIRDLSRTLRSPASTSPTVLPRKDPSNA